MIYELWFFICASLLIFKYGNNSLHLSGWIPKNIFRYARGSFLGSIMLTEVLAEIQDDPIKYMGRIERLFAEVSRKQLPR